jgi:hypothetical protein
VIEVSFTKVKFSDQTYVRLAQKRKEE